jgi:hypothetical protein
MSTNVSAPPVPRADTTAALLERKKHLAALPRIQKILEIVQKNNGFA